MTTEERCNCRNTTDSNSRDPSVGQFQLPCVVKKDDKLSSYDIIWDAIPFYELLDYAKAHHDICSLKSDNDIRLCADQIVRSAICPCCAEQEHIINAIVEEFIGQLKNSNEEGQ